MRFKLLVVELYVYAVYQNATFLVKNVSGFCFQIFHFFQFFSKFVHAFLDFIHWGLS